MAGKAARATEGQTIGSLRPIRPEKHARGAAGTCKECRRHLPMSANRRIQRDVRPPAPGRRRSVPYLPESTGKQLIKGSYDCITFFDE